jgi:hypothetical protein
LLGSWGEGLLKSVFFSLVFSKPGQRRHEAFFFYQTRYYFQINFCVRKRLTLTQSHCILFFSNDLFQPSKVKSRNQAKLSTSVLENNVTTLFRGAPITQGVYFDVCSYHCKTIMLYQIAIAWRRNIDNTFTVVKRT